MNKKEEKTKKPGKNFVKLCEALSSADILRYLIFGSSSNSFGRFDVTFMTCDIECLKE